MVCMTNANPWIKYADALTLTEKSLTPPIRKNNRRKAKATWPIGMVSKKALGQ